ncbi:probable glycerol-3-phosphate acyltransferase 3 [Chenopodium quinoa]|nr:probable glycerol-3-phosphate acyltransferase 3 [Chenopodium quinoa]
MQQNYHKFTSLTKVEDDEMFQKNTLVFSMEDILLKSSSMFPYFMLVAFEGGGPIRALILLLMYPFLCMLEEDLRFEIMVFICFFGIKKESFKIGRIVLPKFFLENVGCESLEVVMKFGRKVGVTKLPKVMVEGFLMDFLGVEDIIGQEIGVIGGYYTGLLDKSEIGKNKQEKIFSHMMSEESQYVGICGFTKSYKTRPFNILKDIYLVSKDDKKSWNNLPKEKYPKPLIFHDGRLAFMPTPLDTLTMFMWLPFGIILSITRVLVAVLLPHEMCSPIAAFLGLRYPYTPSKDNPKYTNKPENSKGMIYVCNHKTLLDAVYVSHICRMNLFTLTYSISKLSKFLCPIDTIELTRDREKDAAIMYKVLSQGRNVILCPEGTTCREPYLLRFSPLFAELSDDLNPVALQVDVSMFYGTTASGIKAFDPFFFMMNPWPSYHVKFLEKLPKEWTCGSGGRTRFEVANYVQDVIGKALSYTCTGLTRKDKYLVLAGNNGLYH